MTRVTCSVIALLIATHFLPVVAQDQPATAGKPSSRQSQPPEFKVELQETVSAAFEARQQRKRSELTELQKRLARLQTLFEAGELVEDKIIDRRVDELLNPKLRWQLDKNADTQGQTKIGEANPLEFETRVSFDHPQEATVTIDGEKDLSIVIPGKVPATTGQTLRFTLSKIAEYEGVELAGSVILASGTEQTKLFLPSHGVPIRITSKDIDKAIRGELVTQVAYLRNTKKGERPRSLSLAPLDPGMNPLEEAKKRGATILSVLHIGNRTEPLKAKGKPDGGVATATKGKFDLTRGPSLRIDNIIPRSQRWQVHWMPTDLADYTRQLDFFKIELGVAAGGKPLVDYASRVSKPQPVHRQGPGLAEKRLFTRWKGKGGKLVEFDKAILARAGISTSNRVLLQFYPEMVEDQMAWIEKFNAEKMGHKSVEEYHKTIFGVRPVGTDYEFFIKEQRFRPAGKRLTYQQLDASARHLAQQVRQLEKLLDPQHPLPRKLKIELRNAVTDALEARQQLQQVEVIEIEKQIARRQSFIDTRERAKDKIIERRVDELLNPALLWQLDRSAAVQGQLYRSAARPPVVEALVISVADGKVEISVGYDDGIKNGMRLSVFEDQTRIGRIWIIKTAADRSVGRIEVDHTQKPIRRGARVTSRVDSRGAANEAGPLGAPSVVFRNVSPRAVTQFGSSAGHLAAAGPGPQVSAQVLIRHPHRATVTMSFDGDKSLSMVIPGRLPAMTGQTLRFTLSNITEYEGVDLTGSIELASISAQTDSYLAHNAVPIEITSADVDQAISGKLVTKVIFLPNAENAEFALAGVESLVTTRLEPGINPLDEAKRRGVILAVLRIGNRNGPPIAEAKPNSGVATARTDLLDLAQDPRIENIIPRWERWQVHWTPADMQDYARQLDFFRIELGAVGGGTSVVDYVTNASKPQPDSKQGAGPDEKRLFMSWRGKGGKLVNFDKAILAKAGVSTRNRVLLQFYPAQVEDQLAWVEKMNADKMGRKSVEEYLQTIFGVRPKGKGYEFYVEEQRFRPAPR